MEPESPPLVASLTCVLACRTAHIPSWSARKAIVVVVRQVLAATTITATTHCLSCTSKFRQEAAAAVAAEVATKKGRRNN